jgi:DNA-binding FadR family transcriptional regulator
VDVFRAIGSKEGLVDRIVNEIEELIVTGQLELDTKLPPERELADQLRVSRSVLREATRILVTKGLLETRPGKGTLVRRMTSEQVAEPLSLLMRTNTGGEVSFDQLHVARTVLEVEIAGMAATQATEDDIAHLRQIVAAMETSPNDPETLAARDADFHRALVNMTGNPLLVVFSDSIRDLLRRYISAITPCLDPQQDILPPHRTIVERVAAKDPERARQAMQEHQHQMRRNYEKYLVLSRQDSSQGE